MKNRCLTFTLLLSISLLHAHDITECDDWAPAFKEAHDELLLRWKTEEEKKQQSAREEQEARTKLAALDAQQDSARKDLEYYEQGAQSEGKSAIAFTALAMISAGVVAFYYDEYPLAYISLGLGTVGALIFADNYHTMANEREKAQATLRTIETQKTVLEQQVEQLIQK